MTEFSTENSETEDDRYHVPGVVRAFQIMELLSQEPGELGISEIASRLSLPKNSVFRILTTLTYCGYLRRDPERKVFGLTHKMLSVGYAAIDEANFMEKALEPMRYLRDQVKESVLIGTLSGGHGVVLDQIPSPHPIKVLVEIGHQFPLHSAAPAKAILAFMNAEERESIIQKIRFTRFTDYTITSRSAFRDELEQIRIAGYSIDRGEEVEEIHCVAAPIRNHRNQPIASIWTTGPRTRLGEDLFEKTGAQVTEQANVISKRLGWIAPAATPSN